MNEKITLTGTYYVCKRYRMLTYLRDKGFIPEVTLPDMKNPKLYVWKFKITPELEETINDYFEELKTKGLYSNEKGRYIV